MPRYRNIRTLLSRKEEGGCNEQLRMRAQPEANAAKQGKIVINDFAQMNPASGNLFVCLYNDNAVYSITPTIKVTAVTVKENWGKRNVQKMTVTSRKEAYLE